MPVDYELPFADRSERRAHRVAAALAACDAGAKPWCWKALEMALAAEAAPIAKRVEAHCRAGDLLSCRALPVSPEQRYPDLPGAAGRSEACIERTEACDRGRARAECAAGFPASCAAVGDTLEHLISLAADGCDAGILSECTFAVNPAAELRQARKVCELIGACSRLAYLAEDAGKPLEARDAYERTCQYAEGGAPWKRCVGLGRLYLDHELPEPVPGRGQALLDWSCHLAEKDLNEGDKITDLLPQCARMTPHR